MKVLWWVFGFVYNRIEDIPILTKKQAFERKMEENTPPIFFDGDNSKEVTNLKDDENKKNRKNLIQVEINQTESLLNNEEKQDNGPGKNLANEDTSEKAHNGTTDRPLANKSGPNQDELKINKDSDTEAINRDNDLTNVFEDAIAEDDALRSTRKGRAIADTKCFITFHDIHKVKNGKVIGINKEGKKEKTSDPLRLPQTEDSKDTTEKNNLEKGREIGKEEA